MPTDQEIEVLKVLKQNDLPIEIIQQPSEEDFNYVASQTETPSGETGLQKSQEARRVFADVKAIVDS